MKRKVGGDFGDETEEQFPKKKLKSDEILIEEDGFIDELEIQKYKKFLPSDVNLNMEDEYKTWKQEIFKELKWCAENKDFEKLVDVFYLIQRFEDSKYKINLEETSELIKLIYLILIDPEVDFMIQTKCAKIITQLIKKNEKLDLVLDWKPLMNIVEQNYFTKFRKNVYTPKDHGTTIVNMIKKINRYFSEDSALEIFERLKPELCIHDHLLFKAQGFLCLFVPPKLLNFELIDEFLNIWNLVGLYPTYDLGFVSLFSNFAEENIGKIKWELYSDNLFAKFLKFFDVPIGNAPSIYDEYPNEECNIFGSFEYSKNLLMIQVSKLIIWMISPENNTLDYLKKLIKSIDSYFHPSNEGNWTGILGDFLLILCTRFAKRLKKENNDTTFKIIPKHSRITDEMCKEFVEIILPITFTAMYSKTSQMTLCANHSIKQLTYICPDFVIPPLIEKCMFALQTLTETHQTTVALETLSIVIFPLLNKSIFSNGKKYLQDLMNLTIPGIDVNDLKKTWSSIKFYTALLVTINLNNVNQTNSSSSINEQNNLDEYFDPNFFEDWCTCLLDKMFTILSNQNLEKDKENNLDSETIPSNVFWGFFDLFFNQLSPSLYLICLKKVFNFISNQFSINALKNIGHLCNSICFSNPKIGLSYFIPMLFDNLIDKKNESLKDLTLNEIVYYLHILGQVVYRTNSTLLNYKNELKMILNLTLFSKEKKISKESGKLLKNILRNFTFYYSQDFRSLNPDIWNDNKMNKNEYWGEYQNLNELKIDWHIPNKEEITFSNELINEYLSKIFKIIEEYTLDLKNEQVKNLKYSNQEIKNHLKNVYYILVGGSSLLNEIKSDIIPNMSKINNSNVTLFFKSTNYLEIGNDKYSFENISILINNLLDGILKSNKNEFIDLLTIIPKLIYSIFCIRGGIDKLSYLKEKSGYQYVKAHNFKSCLDNRGKYPRYMLVRRVNLDYFNRIILHLDSIEYTKLHECLLQKLIQLSLSTYSKIRKKSQNILEICLKRFSTKVTFQFLPNLISLINDENIEDEKRTGAIYILERQISKNIISNWKSLFQIMNCISKTYFVTKQTIQDRIMELHDSLFNHTYQLKIKNENEKLDYQKFIENLIKIEKNESNLHWKYQSIIGSFLILLIRSDNIKYPISGIKWFLNNLTNDIDKIRILSIEGLNLIFQQYKPIQPTVYLEIKNEIKWDELLSNEKQDVEIFYDKNYYGFNKTKNKLKFYDYKKDIEFSKDSIELKEFLSNNINKEFISNWFNLINLREESFSETMAQLFKGFTQILQNDFILICKDEINNCMKHFGSGIREEISYVSTISEYLSGVIRGMKHWPIKLQKENIPYLIEIFENGLENSTLNCIDEWCECIEFILSDKDPRRVKWLRDLLYSKFEHLSLNETSESKYLKYLYSYTNAIYWRDPNLKNLILKKLTNYLDHPYEQIRESISSFFSVIFKSFWKSNNISSNSILCDEFLILVFSKFEKYLKQDKNLIENESFKSFSRTILSFIFGLFSSHVPFYNSIQPIQFLKMLIIIQENSDEEIQNLVRGTIYMIAIYPFSKKISKDILNFLIQILKENDQWKIKITILQFLQIFGYQQQFYLKIEEEKIFNILIHLFNDNQLEVRELTSDTLAGFFKFSTSKLIFKFIKLFENSIHQKKDKKKVKCGIFGYISIIKAFPYEIPSFLPNILVELSSFSNKKEYIEIVRKTFSDFRKNHFDQWHIHKESFSLDQLEKLNDLLISPSYYA
eukprot:gene4215-7552_t